MQLPSPSATHRGRVLLRGGVLVATLLLAAGCAKPASSNGTPASTATSGASKASKSSAVTSTSSATSSTNASKTSSTGTEPSSKSATSTTGKGSSTSSGTTIPKTGMSPLLPLTGGALMLFGSGVLWFGWRRLRGNSL